MRIVINVDDVIGSLCTAAIVVNAKPTIQMLGNYLCIPRTVNGRKELWIVASDGEIWVGCGLPVEEMELSDGDGSFCIDAQDFVSTLKNLSGCKVDMHINLAEYTANCDYGKGIFRIPVFDAKSYPMPRKISEENTTVDIVIDSHVVANLISKTRNFVGNLSTMPQFNGIRFELSESSLTCFSTDGQKMVRATSGIKSYNGSPIGMTLPIKAANNILPILLLSNDGDYVHMSSDGHNALFVTSGWRVITSLIDMNYPNCNKIIPSNDKSVCVNTKDLLMAIKRVLTLGNKATKLVDFEINSKSLKLMAENIDFSTSTEEHMPCTGNIPDGETINIRLNGDYLIGLLQNIETENAVIKLAAPNIPVMIMNEDDVDGNKYLSLQCPLL